MKIWNIIQNIILYKNFRPEDSACEVLAQFMWGPGVNPQHHQKIVKKQPSNFVSYVDFAAKCKNSNKAFIYFLLGIKQAQILTSMNFSCMCVQVRV